MLTSYFCILFALLLNAVVKAQNVLTTSTLQCIKYFTQQDTEILKETSILTGLPISREKILTGGKLQKVIFWNFDSSLRSAAQPAEFYLQTGDITQMFYLGDGGLLNQQIVIVGDSQGNINIFNINSDSNPLIAKYTPAISSQAGVSLPITGITGYPDSNSLFIISQDKQISVINLDGKLIGKPYNSQYKINALLQLQGTKLVAAALDSQKQIQIIDVSVPDLIKLNTKISTQFDSTCFDLVRNQTGTTFQTEGVFAVGFNGAEHLEFWSFTRFVRISSTKGIVPPGQARSTTLRTLDIAYKNTSSHSMVAQISNSYGAVFLWDLDIISYPQLKSVQTHMDLPMGIKSFPNDDMFFYYGQSSIYNKGVAIVLPAQFSPPYNQVFADYQVHSKVIVADNQIFAMGNKDTLFMAAQIYPYTFNTIFPNMGFPSTFHFVVDTQNHYLLIAGRQVNQTTDSVIIFDYLKNGATYPCLQIASSDTITGIDIINTGNPADYVQLAVTVGKELKIIKIDPWIPSCIGQNNNSFIHNSQKVETVVFANFVNSSSFIVTSGDDFTIKLWNSININQILTGIPSIQLQTANIITQMRFIKNSNFLLTYYGSNTIQMYQIQSNSLVINATFGKFASGEVALDFLGNNENDLVIATTSQNLIYLWKLSTGDNIKNINLIYDNSYAIDVIPSTQILVFSAPASSSIKMVSLFENVICSSDNIADKVTCQQPSQIDLYRWSSTISQCVKTACIEYQDFDTKACVTKAVCGSNKWADDVTFMCYSSAAQCSSGQVGIQGVDNAKVNQCRYRCIPDRYLDATNVCVDCNKPTDWIDNQICKPNSSSAQCSSQTVAIPAAINNGKNECKRNCPYNLFIPSTSSTNRVCSTCNLPNDWVSDQFICYSNSSAQMCINGMVGVLSLNNNGVNQCKDNCQQLTFWNSTTNACVNSSQCFNVGIYSSDIATPANPNPLSICNLTCPTNLFQSTDKTCLSCTVADGQFTNINWFLKNNLCVKGAILCGLNDTLGGNGEPLYGQLALAGTINNQVNVCVQTCLVNQVADKNNICNNCDTSCAAGKCKVGGDPTNCTACNGEQFLDGNPVGSCVASAINCSPPKKGVLAVDNIITNKINQCLSSCVNPLQKINPDTNICVIPTSSDTNLESPDANRNCSVRNCFVCVRPAICDSCVKSYALTDTNVCDDGTIMHMPINSSEILIVNGTQYGNNGTNIQIIQSTVSQDDGLLWRLLVFIGIPVLFLLLTLLICLFYKKGWYCKKNVTEPVKETVKADENPVQVIDFENVGQEQTNYGEENQWADDYYDPNAEYNQYGNEGYDDGYGNTNWDNNYTNQNNTNSYY